MSASVTEARDSPLVSVVIPAYNRAPYLVPAVLSALHQWDTGRGHEVIVVDDGSTDGTREVLEPYRSRIRYVYQENGGLSAARNHGLKLARGEFVQFLDADDFLLPEALVGQLACFEARPELGVVQGGWRIVDRGGRMLRQPEPWKRYPHLDLETWVRDSPLCVCAMLIRRSWAERVGGFDPGLRQQEDVDFVLRLALLGCEFAWLPRPTYCYRQHDDNMSGNAREQVRSAEIVFERFFARPELPERIREMKAGLLYHRYAWYAWRLQRTGFPEDISDYLRRSFAHSPFSPQRTVLSWCLEFTHWSHGVGVTDVDIWGCLPHMRAAVPLDAQVWSDLEPVLPWWVVVWAHYIAGTPPPDEARAEYDRRSTEEVLSLARFSLVLSPVDGTVETTARFWEDARTRNLVPPLRNGDLAGLYLTGFGQAVMARRWRVAGQALKQAVRRSRDARAIIAWWRFLAAAVSYALSGPERRRVTWE